MYSIINQYSFLLVGLLLLISISIILRQFLDFKTSLILILIVTATLIFSQAFLKTKKSEILKVEDLNKSIELHEFTLIQIYSDY